MCGTASCAALVFRKVPSDNRCQHAHRGATRCNNLALPCLVLGWVCGGCGCERCFPTKDDVATSPCTVASICCNTAKLLSSACLLVCLAWSRRRARLDDQPPPAVKGCQPCQGLSTVADGQHVGRGYSSPDTAEFLCMQHCYKQVLAALFVVVWRPAL